MVLRNALQHIRVAIYEIHVTLFGRLMHETVKPLRYAQEQIFGNESSHSFKAFVLIIQVVEVFLFYHPDARIFQGLHVMVAWGTCQETSVLTEKIHRKEKGGNDLVSFLNMVESENAGLNKTDEVARLTFTRQKVFLFHLQSGQFARKTFPFLIGKFHQAFHVISYGLHPLKTKYDNGLFTTALALRLHYLRLNESRF